MNITWSLFDEFLIELYILSTSFAEFTTSPLIFRIMNPFDIPTCLNLPSFILDTSTPYEIPYFDLTSLESSDKPTPKTLKSEGFVIEVSPC